MATITVDLPESLVDELRKHNVSNNALSSVMKELLENWLSGQFPNLLSQTILDKRGLIAEGEWSEFDPMQMQPKSSVSFTNEQGMEMTQANEHQKLWLIEQAATDSKFLTDLNETMADFAPIDSEWWEPDK